MKIIFEIFKIWDQKFFFQLFRYATSQFYLHSLESSEKDFWLVTENRFWLAVKATILLVDLKSLLIINWDYISYFFYKKFLRKKFLWFHHNEPSVMSHFLMITRIWIVNMSKIFCFEWVICEVWRGSMEEQKKIILRNWEKISEKKCVWELNYWSFQCTLGS